MNEILENFKLMTWLCPPSSKSDPDAIGSQGDLRDVSLRAHFPQSGFKQQAMMNQPWLGFPRWTRSGWKIYEGGFGDCLWHGKRYATGDFLIKIDHPNDDAYGDLSGSIFESSSHPVMSWLHFAKELDLELPVSAARLLYVTGRFLYPTTSTRTFEIAAMRSIPFDFWHLLGRWIRSTLRR